MPVVKVWCLPPKRGDFQDIRDDIVAAAISVHEVGVENGNTISVLFPEGLENKVIIEVISRTFDARRLSASVRNQFAMAMVFAVKKFYPNAMVECFILPFGRADGFYHSSAE